MPIRISVLKLLGVGLLGGMVFISHSPPAAGSSPPPPEMLKNLLSLPEVWGYITEVASLAGVAAPSVAGLAEAIAKRLEEEQMSWAAAKAEVYRSLLQESGKSIIDRAVEEIIKTAGRTVDLSRITFTPPSPGELEKVRISGVEEISDRELLGNVGLLIARAEREPSENINWDAKFDEFVQSFGFSPQDDAVAKALAARVIKVVTGVDPETSPDEAREAIGKITDQKTKAFLEAAGRRLGITMPNRHPLLEPLAGPERIRPGEKIALTAKAFDPDADPLSYRWSSSAGEILGSGPTVTWQAPDKRGQYIVEVTVDDGRGGTDSQSLTIEVIQDFDLDLIAIVGLITAGALLLLFLLSK